MDYLRDTQGFLWYVDGSPILSNSVIISDPDVKKYISIISLWAIAIKTYNQKLNLGQPFETLHFLIQQNNFSSLDIKFAHLVYVQKLPFYYRDPFDRLLIARAVVENPTIISSDTDVKSYGVNLIE